MRTTMLALRWCLGIVGTTVSAIIFGVATMSAGLLLGLGQSLSEGIGTVVGILCGIAIVCSLIRDDYVEFSAEREYRVRKYEAEIASDSRARAIRRIGVKAE